ncbi:hypothetical protein KIPB_003400 [Kipferlia bialata]|uniref:Uncharacterized protein n=1 Tax=Kipferlia bialata TaxID=797122 RepID=A0A9K3CSE8_9EUKA|nr:hypothetical protein KIPB_003400 [Kipferlia bialata]|eukprot:g3400.t1
MSHPRCVIGPVGDVSSDLTKFLSESVEPKETKGDDGAVSMEGVPPPKAKVKPQLTHGRRRENSGHKAAPTTPRRLAAKRKSANAPVAVGSPVPAAALSVARASIGDRSVERERRRERVRQQLPAEMRDLTSHSTATTRLAPQPISAHGPGTPSRTPSHGTMSMSMGSMSVMSVDVPDMDSGSAEARPSTTVDGHMCIERPPSSPILSARGDEGGGAVHMTLPHVPRGTRRRIAVQKRGPAINRVDMGASVGARVSLGSRASSSSGRGPYVPQYLHSPAHIRHQLVRERERERVTESRQSMSTREASRSNVLECCTATVRDTAPARVLDQVSAVDTGIDREGLYDPSMDVDPAALRIPSSMGFSAPRNNSHANVHQSYVHALMGGEVGVPSGTLETETYTVDRELSHSLPTQRQTHRDTRRETGSCVTFCQSLLRQKRACALVYAMREAQIHADRAKSGALQRRLSSQMAAQPTLSMPFLVVCVCDRVGLAELGWLGVANARLVLVCSNPVESDISYCLSVIGLGPDTSVTPKGHSPRDTCSFVRDRLHIVKAVPRGATEAERRRVVQSAKNRARTRPLALSALTCALSARCHVRVKGLALSLGCSVSFISPTPSQAMDPLFRRFALRCNLPSLSGDPEAIARVVSPLSWGVGGGVAIPDGLGVPSPSPLPPPYVCSPHVDMTDTASLSLPPFVSPSHPGGEGTGAVYVDKDTHTLPVYGPPHPSIQGVVESAEADAEDNTLVPAGAIYHRCLDSSSLSFAVTVYVPPAALEGSTGMGEGVHLSDCVAVASHVVIAPCLLGHRARSVGYATLNAPDTLILAARQVTLSAATHGVSGYVTVGMSCQIGTDTGQEGVVSGLQLRSITPGVSPLVSLSFVSTALIRPVWAWVPSVHFAHLATLDKTSVLQYMYSKGHSLDADARRGTVYQYDHMRGGTGLLCIGVDTGDPVYDTLLTMETVKGAVTDLKEYVETHGGEKCVSLPSRFDATRHLPVDVQCLLEAADDVSNAPLVLAGIAEMARQLDGL